VPVGDPYAVLELKRERTIPIGTAMCSEKSCACGPSDKDQPSKRSEIHVDDRAPTGAHTGGDRLWRASRRGASASAPVDATCGSIFSLN
jgi:hypothetical protein